MLLINKLIAVPRCDIFSDFIIQSIFSVLQRPAKQTRRRGPASQQSGKPLSIILI